MPRWKLAYDVSMPWGSQPRVTHLECETADEAREWLADKLTEAGHDFKIHSVTRDEGEA